MDLRSHSITKRLGNEAGGYTRILDDLVPTLDGTLYEFLPLEEMPKAPVQVVNQIYWREILYRAHWAASATAIRLRQWIHGLSDAHQQSNLLATAACARGLIEAAADSNHGLSFIAPTLARDHERVRSAIEGTLVIGFLAPEIEDRLIHFTHARKPEKGELIPPSHVALPVYQYRAVLDKEDSRVAECYATLCDLTHPGASSVLSYAVPEDEKARRVRLSLKAEAVSLSELIGALHEVLPTVLTFGLNPALVTLKVLNALPLQQVNAPFMNGINLSNIPAWQKAARHLGTAP